MRADTRLPSHAAVRLFPCMPPGALWHAVIISRLPREATPDAWATLMKTPGAVLACLTHDKGVTWPDRKGEAMVHAALEGGGMALLAFSDLGDALMCKRRAERSRRTSDRPSASV